MIAGAILAGCQSAPVEPPAPPAALAAPAAKATPPAVQGEEIIVAGQRFAVGTRVITWMDPGGYDAYRGAWLGAPVAKKSAAPARKPHFNERLSAPGGPPIRPDLPGLRGTIDQLVLHYDECGLSKLCFEALEQRGLSTHFLLDVDGTIYQTLDLRERAWHATTANDRSIGVEIANIGAYPPGETKAFAEWYQSKSTGDPRLVPPLIVGNPRIRTPNFIARPLRPNPVRGKVQGKDLVQYDFTPEQYAALIKLTAALHRIFPKLPIEYPHDVHGRLIAQKLSDEELAKYQGVLGHFHIQDNKIDPGPAFQWNLLIDGARRQTP